MVEILTPEMLTSGFNDFDKDVVRDVSVDMVILSFLIGKDNLILLVPHADKLEEYLDSDEANETLKFNKAPILSLKESLLKYWGMCLYTGFVYGETITKPQVDGLF